MSFHSEQTAIHRVHSFEYVDAAARLAATGFIATDVGKVARQLDDDSWWILNNISPACNWARSKTLLQTVKYVSGRDAASAKLNESGIGKHNWADAVQYSA